MTHRIKTDLCVIGGGSGGLSVAAGAVQMGAGVVLLEGHKMGGDCLNYGCVPSKALIAAARRSASNRRSRGSTSPPRRRMSQMSSRVSRRMTASNASKNWASG